MKCFEGASRSSVLTGPHIRTHPSPHPLLLTGYLHLAQGLLPAASIRQAESRQQGPLQRSSSAGALPGQCIKERPECSITSMQLPPEWVISHIPGLQLVSGLQPGSPSACVSGHAGLSPAQAAATGAPVPQGPRAGAARTTVSASWQGHFGAGAGRGWLGKTVVG